MSANDIHNFHSREYIHGCKCPTTKKRGKARMHKPEIYYTRQREVPTSDFALFTHNLVQVHVANESKISHLRVILHSRKRRHSRTMVVANEDEILHSQTILRHSRNVVVANEQVNPHSHTSLDLRQNLYSPLENQGLTIVHITLTGVPTMLMDQLKQQVINQVGIFRLSGHEENLQHKRKELRQRSLKPVLHKMTSHKVTWPPHPSYEV